LFKDIVLVKYNANTRVEIDRITVPIEYVGKENWLARLYALPNLPAVIEKKLPTMSFEITSLEYDAARKQQTGLQNFNRISGSNSSVNNQYIGVPYNLRFELSIYVRNMEDGLQIVEQILPYFTPNYTLTMDFVDGMGIVKNIPITLDQVSFANQFQGDAKVEERIIIWTLNFNMQTFLFGPTYTGNIIKQATANTFYYGETPTANGFIVLTTSNTPFGNFKAGEIVYQGFNIPDANATGTVIAWNAGGFQLAIGNVIGTFVVGSNVKGSSSAASANVLAAPTDALLSTIVVVPNPVTANLGDDFGFTTTITDWPDTY
jgi:T4-like virus Myoviridae tail sheath stabiliser